MKNWKKRGYRIALITSDYDTIAQYIKKEFGFDYAVGCKERFDQNGILQGVSDIIDEREKLKKLKEFVRLNNGSLENCTYIGNDANDRLVFKASGHSIAYEASEEVRKLAEDHYEGPILGLLERLQ